MKTPISCRRNGIGLQGSRRNVEIRSSFRKVDLITRPYNYSFAPPQGPESLAHRAPQQGRYFVFKHLALFVVAFLAVWVVAVVAVIGRAVAPKRSAFAVASNEAFFCGCQLIKHAF